MGSTWPPGWAGPRWVEHPATAAATPIGSLAGPERLLVDPGGYLSVDGCDWGVDWWIGADDRWHLPGREVAVRQHLVGSAPVVQTSVRVPGGDVHATVGVVAGPEGSRAVVEVHNDSAAPVALAVAVRPATCTGPGRVGAVALDGTTVVVDGAPVVALPEPPSRAWCGGGADGDPFDAVRDGGAHPVAAPLAVADADGLAGLVVVVPVAHRATYRWQLGLPQAVGAADHLAPVAAPGLDAVVRGWAAQTERQVRLDLPPLAALDPVDAVRAHLLLAAARADADPEVLVAAATAGVGAAAADVAPGADPTGASTSLWAVEALARLSGAQPDATAVAATAEVVAAAGRRRARSAPTAPVAVRAAGLGAAGRLLAAVGERRAAAKVERLAADLDPVAARPRLVPPACLEPTAGPAASAVVAAAAADPEWLDRLAAVAASATPTVTWPGPAGRPDPVVAARYWLAVRAALVDDRDPHELLLLPGWCSAFGRAPLEVHGLPSAAGVVGVVLRWHDDRPALLWEVDGAPAGLVVRAPGLDPSWAGGRSGEALLASPGRQGGGAR